MNDETTNSVHWSFWLISIFALLWNIGGSINFFMQMDPNIVATFPDSHRAIIEGRPIWATGGFAVSVFCGAIGGLLLLLMRPFARYLFIFSLIGTVVTVIHTIIVAVNKIEFAFHEIVIMILLPLIMAEVFVWYSQYAIRKGWVK